MKISKEDVLRVAGLARLEFDDIQIDKFTYHFENIMKFISKLDELNTEDITPTSHVLEVSTPLREDIVSNWLTQEESLKNAPESDSGFFTVPKIIED